MGRIGLALVLVVGLGAVSHADRIACEPPIGEADIPGDALTIPEAVPQVQTAAADKTPPAAPTNVTVTIAQDDGETWISLAGTYDPNTAYIRAIFDGYQLITTPDRTDVCTRHKVTAGSRVKIVAYNKSRNESAAFDADVTPVQHHEPEPSHHHDRHGMDVLVTVGAIVLACMLFVGLVLIGFARKRAPFSVAGEFLSPILAENVARAVARGYQIKLAVSAALIVGLLALHHVNIAILIGPFAAAWMIELFVAQLVVGQFDNKVQRLEKRELWIYINSSKLWAPAKVWDKASSLPSAGLAKRD